MRPVDRGACPVDGTGSPRAFSRYEEAQPDLCARLGWYCCYCEIHVPDALHVEHIFPKNPALGYAHLELSWENFLLACGRCNGTKQDTIPHKHLFLSPDRDNTFHAFEYTQGGLVRPHPTLSSDGSSRAQRTLVMIGLDRQPGHPKHKANDGRWIKRSDAWDIANKARDDLLIADSPNMRELITTLAQQTGCWSIWMTVFRNEPDMLCRFIGAFPGTAGDCFDTRGGSLPRPRGAL